MSNMQVQRVLETCLYAQGVERAAKFYRDVLGLVPQTAETGRHHFFRCGRSMFLLFNPAETVSTNDDIPPHGTNDAAHVAFAVRAREMHEWRDKLLKQGVEVENQLNWPNGGSSLYFRDPAGNSVEITTPQTWGLADDDDY